MIVPIILNYNLSKKNDGLWIFYKFLDFCKKNNTFIVGNEEYFQNPKKYKNNWALNENVMKMYNYDYPDIDFLNINKDFMVSDEVKKALIKKNIEWSYLLSNRCELIEDAVNISIDKIEKYINEKVEIIITWYPVKSLEYICKEKNIKLLSAEFSGIRKEWYNVTLSSISLKNKYNSSYDIKKINELDFSNKIVLTREELIILFSYSNDLLNNLKLLKSSPIYEIGYALGLDNDPYEKAFCNIKQKDVIKTLKKNYESNEILFRLHPQLKADVKGNIDDSRLSRDFISKCNKIVVMISNVGYEAALYGRRVSYLNKNFLTSMGRENSLLNLSDSVISLEELNFITFGLYTLFENLFDVSFLKKFAENKYDINKLYEDNMKQLFTKLKLDYNVMKELNGNKRTEYILKNAHNMSIDDIKQVKKIKYNRTIYEENLNFKKIIEEKNILLEKKVEENNYLNKKVFDYESILDTIYNSKLWAICERLRKIKNILRRK